MSYLDRLKAKIAETSSCEELPKLTKPGSVSFGSDLHKQYPENDTVKLALADVPIAHAVSKRQGVPADILAGLDRLRGMRRPRIQRPELWQGIVSDTLRIETDGWGGQALALGWEPLLIFGYQPSDDPEEFSLAVELSGRSIVAVDKDRFYLRHGDVRRFFENRPRPLLTRYLWDFDR
jgi:hypothetical protein